MSQSSAHRAIYRRWRAQTFAQIVGQDAVVQTLRNAVRTDRVAHAILFVGPRGTGKTSLARIVAKALNCTDLRDGDPCDACSACVTIREGTTLDVVEIDAASNRGINEIRELRDRLNYAPAELRRKVYILDEAHQITRDAWNALLKSLEEPPDFVAFMFASTHPQDFPPAVLSRLQRYDVRRLTVSEIQGKLGRILEADGRRAEPAALDLIARLAAGGMRDAETMLDQLLSSGSDPLAAAEVRDLLGLAESEAVGGFVDALVASDAAVGIGILDSLEDRGRDARTFLDQVVEAVRAELVESFAAPAGAGRDAATLVAAARRLAAIDPNRAGTGGLRLQLELALFPDRSVAAPPRSVAADADAPNRRSRAASPAGASPTPSPDNPPANAVRAKPAPTDPVRTPAPRPEPAADDPLAVVLREWAAIVARVSERPALKPLIMVCRPISVEGPAITLGYPEEQAFLRDVAERKRAALEEVCAEVLGRPVAIRFIVANLEQAPALPADADDGFVLAEARRIFADDLVDVREIG